MKRSSKKQMEKLSALRDMQEITKVKVSNVVFEAVNTDTVNMSTEDAAKLIQVIRSVVDDCFSLVASRQ